MICMIEGYMFDVKETETLSHELLFSWVERNRLGNHPLSEATGAWSENINLQGRLLAKSVRALDSFEEICKQKRPLRFTLGTGESFMVIVTALSRRKKEFLKDGKYIVHEFDISLKRWFE